MTHHDPFATVHSFSDSSMPARQAVQQQTYIGMTPQQRYEDLNTSPHLPLPGLELTNARNAPTIDDSEDDDLYYYNDFSNDRPLASTSHPHEVLDAAVPPTASSVAVRDRTNTAYNDGTHVQIELPSPSLPGLGSLQSDPQLQSATTIEDTGGNNMASSISTHKNRTLSNTSANQTARAQPLREAPDDRKHAVNLLAVDQLLQRRFALAVDTLRDLYLCGITFDKLVAHEFIEEKDKSHLKELFRSAGLPIIEEAHDSRSTTPNVAHTSMRQQPSSSNRPRQSNGREKGDVQQQTGRVADARQSRQQFPSPSQHKQINRPPQAADPRALQQDVALPNDTGPDRATQLSSAAPPDRSSYLAKLAAARKRKSPAPNVDRPLAGAQPSKDRSAMSSRDDIGASTDVNGKSRQTAEAARGSAIKETPNKNMLLQQKLAALKQQMAQRHQNSAALAPSPIDSSGVPATSSFDKSIGSLTPSVSSYSPVSHNVGPMISSNGNVTPNHPERTVVTLIHSDDSGSEMETDSNDDTTMEPHGSFDPLSMPMATLVRPTSANVGLVSPSHDDSSSTSTPVASGAPNSNHNAQQALLVKELEIKAMRARIQLQARLKAKAKLQTLTKPGTAISETIAPTADPVWAEGAFGVEAHRSDSRKEDSLPGVDIDTEARSDDIRETSYAGVPSEGPSPSNKKRSAAEADPKESKRRRQSDPDIPESQSSLDLKRREIAEIQSHMTRLQAEIAAEMAAEQQLRGQFGNAIERRKVDTEATTRKKPLEALHKDTKNAIAKDESDSSSMSEELNAESSEAESQPLGSIAAVSPSISRAQSESSNHGSAASPHDQHPSQSPVLSISAALEARSDVDMADRELTESSSSDYTPAEPATYNPSDTQSLQSTGVPQPDADADGSQVHPGSPFSVEEGEIDDAGALPPTESPFVTDPDAGEAAARRASLTDESMSVSSGEVFEDEGATSATPKDSPVVTGNTQSFDSSRLQPPAHNQNPVVPQLSEHTPVESHQPSYQPTSYQEPAQWNPPKGPRGAIPAGPRGNANFRGPRFDNHKTEVLGLPSVSTSQPAKVKPVKHEDVLHEVKSHLSDYQPYQSPLQQFKDFRYAPNFKNQVTSFQSLTYSHNIDPSIPFCRFELDGGVCNDTQCNFQHLGQIVLDGSKLLMQLGGKNPGRNTEEQEAFKDGLRNLISGMKTRNLGDPEQIAAEIVAYRRDFLQDPSRILNI